MILKVGLTGGIATGKSTTGRILAGLGCVVIDADRVVTELYRPGAPGFEVILDHYGKGILNDAGEIDRRKLARIAFRSARETEILNDLIHPLVIAYENRMIENESRRFPDQRRIVVVEATLLLESGGRDRYDRIVVVDSESKLQVRRATERGMTRSDVRSRMERQMDREQRLALADYVIRNDGDLEDLYGSTLEVFHRLEDDLDRMANQRSSAQNQTTPPRRGRD
ncbi:MAG: dephospho-CoA kinase [Thermoanaerobaculia bacterium]|nr:dephospho-CoA kinase [Thermoanaerobaculia bacterium]